MSGEGTEQPTPKRLEEARKKGQVAKSRDATSGIAAAAVLLVMAASAPTQITRLRALVTRTLTGAFATEGRAAQRAMAALLDGLGVLSLTVGPLLGLLWGLIFLSGALQTKGLVSFDVLKPDSSRFAPKLNRLVSAEALFNAGKGLVVLILLGGTSVGVLWPWFGAWLQLTGRPVADVLVVLGRNLDALLTAMVFVGLVVGLGDFLWQKHKIGKSLRMTKDEVKREYKESEGDPHHKAERQRVHKEISQQRSIEDVSKADFVVVNPTHIAVAVRYDREGGEAPVVVASGQNLVAGQIKDMARRHGVPVFRDVSLARSMKGLQVGDEIPEALYEAVAELLRLVYGVQEPDVSAREGEPGSPQRPQAGDSAGPGWHRA